MTSVMLAPADTSAGCKDFLVKLKDGVVKVANYRILDMRSKLVKKGEKPLFEDKHVRAKLTAYVKTTYRSRPASGAYRTIDKHEKAALEALITDTEAAIFDPKFAMEIYGKEASEVQVFDGFKQLLKIHTDRLVDFANDPNERVSNYLVRTAEDGIKKSGMFLIKAVVLAGLFFTIQGVGAPFWDYVGASAKRFSFAVTNQVVPEQVETDSGEDGLRARLQDLYRRMNTEYTTVERTANGRVTHVGSTLSFHLGSLASQSDPEVQKVILMEVSRLPIRYADVFVSEEGQYSRNLYEEIVKEYDSENEILPKLPSYQYKYDLDKSPPEPTTEME
jgi:hypothetical protein